MISVNDLTPQLVQGLLDRVELLEKTIYDLDGKALRDKTVSGDTITGGTIIGTLLQTANDTTYMKLHEEFLEIYYANTKVMQLGYSGNGVFPCIQFYGTAGQQVGMITIDGLGNVIYIGPAKFAQQVTLSDNSQAASQTWVANSMASLTSSIQTWAMASFAPK